MERTSFCQNWYIRIIPSIILILISVGISLFINNSGKESFNKELMNDFRQESISLTEAVKRERSIFENRLLNFKVNMLILVFLLKKFLRRILK